MQMCRSSTHMQLLFPSYVLSSELPGGKREKGNLISYVIFKETFQESKTHPDHYSQRTCYTMDVLTDHLFCPPQICQVVTSSVSSKLEPFLQTVPGEC